VATFAANNVTTWFSGYDMTADLNSTTLNLQYDALEDTAFGDQARSRVAGLEDCQLQEAGWWQSATSGAIDPTAFAALGGASQVVSNSPDGLDSSVAYFYRAKSFEYQPFSNKVGEVVAFTLTAQSARGTGLAAVAAVRGRVLKGKGAVSATGATGTPFQLGAVASGQFLYAAFHEFAVGTTITAVLESNADNTFGAATTRATFGPITTVGGTWATRVAGPITDQWYRLRVTAITGTHTIACVAGIK
jgi:hypothetical protein